jgi:two-component system nitrogen regulation response regulator GlnG
MFRRTLKAKDFLVAESPAMRDVVEAVERYAEGDRPVLICGEHGTGRELVARVLHQTGPRRAARFLAVRPTFENADVESNSDDDTDERARRALRAAQGGTLLIKDVCDLPALSQRTLRKAIRRRVLDKNDKPDRNEKPDKNEKIERAEREREARKADATGEVFDVRVVGSADVDLESAVAAKILSRDLYEQLGENRIDVPPLRERVADIPPLVERWVSHYGQEVGRGKMSVSTRAHGRLVKYPWPGNVAELKSLARRLVVRVQGSRIEAGDVDEVLPVVAERVPMEDLAFEDMVKSKLAGLLRRMDGYPVSDLYEKVLQRVERPLFDLVLEHTGGNQVRASEILGLNRNTLRRKLDELGMAKKKRGKVGRDDEALDGE